MGIKKRTVLSWYAILLVVALVAPVSISAQAEYALLTPDAIVQRTNSERVAEDLIEYKKNQMLAAAAEEKARDMATRSYFAHATPEGEKTWNLVREKGYAFSRVGENLAVKFSDPSRVVSMWMASPGHRANLLNEKFVDIGVGVAEGRYQGATTTFIVALYAAPLEEQSVVQGEVKGEQEPPHESAGLMASMEPEPEEVVVKKEQPVVVAKEEIVPPSEQQAAAASAGHLETFWSLAERFLESFWNFLR